MIKRELVIFLIVGSLTVLIDFTTYRFLVWSEMVNVDVAKGSGFLIGALFAYSVNRCWTFGRIALQPGSLWRFGFLYMTTLGVNVIVNSLVLKILVGEEAAVQLAFLFATATSALLNFIGMKLLVFKGCACAGSP